MNIKKIIKFFSEIQNLKRIKREGFRLAGVDSPTSIASHSALSAQIAYVLAKMEGANSEKCALINLFHDNEEVRIGDLHKINARYIDVNNFEVKAEREHYSNLDEVGEEIFNLQKEFRKRNTKEGIICKDADWLECACEAKVYLEKGYKGTENWISNIEKALETESAKKLLQEIKENPDFINCWWYGLKKMTYKKLS